MTTRTERKVKAWALCFGKRSMFAPRGTQGRKRFKAYLTKKYASEKAKEYQAMDCRIIPVTITYEI